MYLKNEDLEKRSTIQVSEDLRNALKDLGKKGERYEDIIWKLINYYNGSQTINVASPPR